MNARFKQILIGCLLFNAICFSTFATLADFITRWDLSKSGSGNTQILFDVETTGNVNYTWQEVGGANLNGFGTFTGTSMTIIDLPSNGVIDLTINPTNFQRIKINGSVDKGRLIEVKQWGAVVWNSMEFAFYGCLNLNVSATDIPNLTNVTSLNRMFYGCNSLIGPANINNWDISKIENLNEVFGYCYNFNQDISSWNVSNVTKTSGLFVNAENFNQDLSSWDVSKVTNMAMMFAGAKRFNQPIGGWNVSKVTTMAFMFAGCNDFNQNIGMWNVSNVKYMVYMFKDCANFNQDIGDWDVAQVQSMSQMFANCYFFNQNVGSWNVENVYDMQRMFYNCYNFNQNISSWNVSKVINMQQMFYYAVFFDQDISLWNFNAEVQIDEMLYNMALSITNYDKLLAKWDLSGMTNKYLGSAIGLKYCAGQLPRTNLINKGWTILNDIYSMACLPPEIAVLGNNNEILNGDNSPSILDFTDFGDQNIHLSNVIRTFTIKNMGGNSLLLTAAPNKVVLSGSSDFIVTIQPTSPLIENSLTTLQITFDPSTIGIKTATVLIENNDSDENPYSFVIQGNGINPCPQQLSLISTTNDVSGLQSFQAGQHINARNKVYSSGNSILQAGNSILLLPGFTVQNGGLFTTVIGGCSNN